MNIGVNLSCAACTKAIDPLNLHLTHFELRLSVIQRISTIIQKLTVLIYPLPFLNIVMDISQAVLVEYMTPYKSISPNLNFK